MVARQRIVVQNNERQEAKFDGDSDSDRDRLQDYHLLIM